MTDRVLSHTALLRVRPWNSNPDGGYWLLVCAWDKPNEADALTAAVKKRAGSRLYLTLIPRKTTVVVYDHAPMTSKLLAAPEDKDLGLGIQKML